MTTGSRSIGSHFSPRAFLVAAVLASSLLACSPHPALPTTAAAPTDPRDTSTLVRRVVAHPRDRERWNLLRDPARRNDAKRLLTIAFNDPANALTEPPSFIRPEGGRDEILDAIAGILGDDALDIVLIAATDHDSVVRSSAINALGRDVKMVTPQTRKALRSALHDPDPSVVIAAMDALRSRPDPDAGPELLELLRHPPQVKHTYLDPQTTYNAGDFAGYTCRDGFNEVMNALAASAFPGAIPDLSALAHDPSAYVRAQAAPTLAACAAHADAAACQASVAVLESLLPDPNRSVCRAAALALADLHDPAAAPVLLFEIKSATREYVKGESRDRAWTIDIVRALEKLTGEDLGASLGEDAWSFDPSDDDFLPRLAAAQPRVIAILQQLRTHHIPTDGYPHLPQTLSAADKAMFDRAFANWLVDPRGAVCISFEIDERTAWAATRKVQITGWLFPAQKDQPAGVLTWDRESFPVPAQYAPHDLVPPARELLDRYLQGRKVWAGAITAAWLYRLGHEDLAAQLLFLARGSGDRADFTLDQPDSGGAWRAFSSAVHAYMVRADDEALVAAERLERLYPRYLDEFGPGTRLLAELRRRKLEGTFNHPAAPLPADFDQWPVDKRVSRLIQDLDEVDARQWGQPGGVDLSGDLRVKKLVAIGDAAVPALIDCIEKDERLTRSVHFWRDFAHSRGILGVREAALTAVMSILRITAFEPVATGDDFTSRGADAARSTAARLRKYWEEYGKLTFDQRMMKVLTNPKANPSATLEAAENLANFGEKRRIGTMVWTGGVDEPPPEPNPLIARYKDPTVAQAILAARDRHLQTLDPNENGGYEARRTDAAYAAALCTLGDASIIPEVRRRFVAESSLELRRRWAMLCFGLREDAPLRELAAGVKAGTITLSSGAADAAPVEDAPGFHELSGFIRTFTAAQTPYCDDALYAIASPRHPYHAIALAGLANLLQHRDSDQETIWFHHPFYVSLMRPLLDQTTPTSTTYTIYKESVREQNSGGWSGRSMPDSLVAAGPANRLLSAQGRACDAPALFLTERLVGSPAYHPLLKDADRRLAELKAYVDLYASQLRPLRWLEIQGLDAGTGTWGEQRFVPAFVPLHRPATRADVTAGHAVFDLGGQGDLVDFVLPGTARLKEDHARKDAPRVLLVQAERDRQGIVHYGIIAPYQIRSATQDELEDIQPNSTPK